MSHMAVGLALDSALLGATYQAGRDGLLDWWPTVRVWVEGWPLSVVIGVG